MDMIANMRLHEAASSAGSPVDEVKEDRRLQEDAAELSLAVKNLRLRLRALSAQLTMLRPAPKAQPKP